MCSNAVLVTDNNYKTTLNNIDKNLTSDIIFRCTVCIGCDRKVANDAPDSVNGPVQSCKFPIGTNMILNWSTYRNVSLYMRKYCKLYSYDGKHHVVENRLDIMESIGEDFYIHEFCHDDKLHLEPGDICKFFITAKSREVKRLKTEYE